MNQLFIKYIFVLFLFSILVGFNGHCETNSLDLEKQLPINVYVILQTHTSPFPWFNQGNKTLQKIDISERYITKTLESGVKKYVLLEGVQRKGSKTNPESLNSDDFATIDLLRRYPILTKSCMFFGFEDSETHAAGTSALEYQSKLAVLMQEPADEMKLLAKKMDEKAKHLHELKETLNDSQVTNDNSSLRIQMEEELSIFKSLTENFSSAEKRFNHLNTKHNNNKLVFNAFCMIRSAQALQAALQIAINNHVNDIFIVIGSAHWEDFKLMEKQINMDSPRKLILHKLEPDYGNLADNP